MTKSIFINLPVKNLEKSKAFYEALGFTNNPQFTDQTAACMVVSETINIMLLTHEKWQTFTARPIPASDSSEVLLAITCDTKTQVDEMLKRAQSQGGIADVNPAQDHGFMVSRSFADLDGHVWEAFWMDMSATAPT